MMGEFDYICIEILNSNNSYLGEWNPEVSGKYYPGMV